jgi:hypothetical protein
MPPTGSLNQTCGGRLDRRPAIEMQAGEMGCVRAIREAVNAETPTGRGELGTGVMQRCTAAQCGEPGFRVCRVVQAAGFEQQVEDIAVDSPLPRLAVVNRWCLTREDRRLEQNVDSVSAQQHGGSSFPTGCGRPLDRHGEPDVRYTVDNAPFAGPRPGPNVPNRLIIPAR